MKFRTRHKAFKINTGRGERRMTAHRDGNKVWATDDGKTIFSHTFEFVSQAKAWMSNPSI